MGIDPGQPPTALADPRAIRARGGLITTLCNYCVGETAALEASSGMIGFAPNRQAKIFLATQVVDEARHLEVLLHRLTELGVTDPESEIEKRGTRACGVSSGVCCEFVDSKDWEAAVFAQNVILEAMEFTVFQAHAERAGSITTKEMLEGIIKDERRHMGFGENDLGRRLQIAPHTRARLGATSAASSTRSCSTPSSRPSTRSACRGTSVPDLGRRYLASVERLGFD